MLTRTLWLAMWNHDTFGHNDFLGEVMLPLETYQESGFSWDDPSPNWYPLHERVICNCMHVTCYIIIVQELTCQKVRLELRRLALRNHQNEATWIG